MRSHRTLCTFTVVVVFAISTILIGAICLVYSSGDYSPKRPRAVFLRLTGQILSGFGAVLLLGTLTACTYMCVIGNPWNTSSRASYDMPTSQLDKVISHRNRPRLRAPFITDGSSTVPRRTQGGTKSVSFAPNYQTDGDFNPGGDGGFNLDQDRDKVATNVWATDKTTLNLEQASNWPTKATNAPVVRLGRRRHRSVDLNNGIYNVYPNVSLQPLMTMENFGLGMRSSGRPSDLELPSHVSLFNQGGESLNSMLHLGGRVRLGDQ